MLAHEHLELSDELGVASELEVSCDPPLDADETNLFEPKNLRLRERLVSEVGERWTAPEIESFAKPSRRQLGRGLLRLLHQPLEAEQVELVRADADHVARLLRDDRLAGSERLAELGNVVLERVRGRLGACVPQSSSMSRPVETTSFARVSSKTRSARCLEPPSVSARPPSTTSSGPRIRNSTLRLRRRRYHPVCSSAGAQRCLSAGLDSSTRARRSIDARGRGPRLSTRCHQ